MNLKRAIRNLYQLVLSHHDKDYDANSDISVDTDAQLRKVQEFVIDLTKITNEIQRDGYAYYTPPSSS